MAKKRRRNRKGFTAIPFNDTNALVTLADATILSGQLLNGVFAEDFFIISIDCTWSLRNVTGGEVPIEVGFAHDDYSIAEIDEYLIVNLLDPDNMIAAEQSKRKVRRVGSFQDGDKTDQGINDGRPVRTPMKFVIGSGHGINHWAKNNSGAVLTTGAVVHMSGTIYGRWLR